MAIIDWEYKFKKQVEINQMLIKQRQGFYWTQEYPKQEGWYWIKVGFDGFPGMEHFWPDSEGKICAQDIEYNLYGEECFQGYWFSNEPIKEPENM